MLQDLHEELGTIVPVDKPRVWLADVKAVRTILQNKPPPQARRLTAAIVQQLQTGSLCDQYKGFWGEMTQRVTRSDVQRTAHSLSPVPTTSASPADRKLILQSVALALLGSGVPAELKLQLAELPLDKCHSAGPYRLCVTGQTLKVLKGGEEVTIPRELKAVLHKSVKLFPRHYLLCKQTDPSVAMGKNHLSKFLAEIFGGRPVKFAELCKDL